jgi:hypothetical protein
MPDFLTGVAEYRSAVTRHYDDLALADSYDRGRKLVHRVTMRRYDR